VKARAKAKAKPRPKAPSRAKAARGRSAAPKASSKKSASAPAPKGGGGSGSFKVRPLKDRILVMRIEEGEQKVGGIIVPDSAREKPTQAQVVAVGSGRVKKDGARVPLAVKAGDKVLIGKWSGTDVKIDGQEYLILKEEEVLGILG
jgi:chaperonin GroES